MHFTTKLKTTSLYRLLVNNLFLLSFLVVLLLLTLDTWYFVFFLCFYLFYLYRKNKTLFLIAIILITIISILFLVRHLLIFDKGLTSFQGYVVSVAKKEYYNRLLVKKGIYKVYVYDYDFLDIKVGDIVTITGTSKKIEQNHLPNLFNYEKYYYSQSIISIIKAEDLSIKSRFNILYIRRWINSYIENNFDINSASFIKGMVLGDTSELSESVMDAIKINNISHLFAISGLHINLIVKMNKKALSIFIKDEKKQDNIISIFLILYLIITNFAVSIFRAVLMYILGIINKRKELKLSSLDIASIAFILLIMINPYYIYHLGFILSFFACFVIIIYSQSMMFLNKKINGFLEIIIITFLLQLSTLPIIININYSFNLLSFITNGFFITIVSYVILPFTFISLLLPFLSGVYSYVIRSFNFLNELISKYFVMKISMPSFNKGEIIIYYLFIFLFIVLVNYFKKRKPTKNYLLYICAFALFLVMHKEKINLNIEGHIYFLDVYEGDATVIDLPFNKGVVMIDTGEESNDVISFLKSIGIKRIDYLILTHNHSDHTGNTEKILNNFQVDKIIISDYHDVSFAGDITRVRAGSVIRISNYSFYVLAPSKRSTNENNNSIVLYAKIGSLKYLFLGDSEKELEEEIAKYDIEVDCIKVAHHGSKTSTTEALYNKLNPSIVFIETGRVSYYGFPSKSVIDFLSKYQIYRTDNDYTIEVIFNPLSSRVKKTKK